MTISRRQLLASLTILAAGSLSRPSHAAAKIRIGVLKFGTVSWMLDVLRRHGVTRIEVPPGAPFDPTVHEAVTQLPTNDHPPGTVAQVLQSGFLLHDRVLRPAGVAVAAEPPAGGNS